MEQDAKHDWQQVRRIFEGALLRPAEERRSYAKGLCGDDEPLWLEISSLLDSHESSESFLETSAVVRVVEDIQAKGNQLAAGQRLLHYEIRRLIGSGGMGEVYLARDTRLGRKVALKLLRGDLLPHYRASERLLREARAAALLEHPNICQIHEISEVDGFSFIVMQYVRGTTLDEILSGEGMDTATALDIASQAAEGLAEAHRRGIIHRDIKPANIIVSDKGRVKILDFGLAKFIEAESGADAVSRMESTGGIMGTVPYMSPEQLLGEPVDARTDIFSFGAMLFEMLSGVSAFGRKKNDETISAILREEPDWLLIPAALQPIVRKSLAKDPQDRYASAGELAESLAAARKSGIKTRPARSQTTSPTGIAPTTGLVDNETRPLYAWQSGGGDISKSGISGRVSKGAGYRSRRIGLFGLLALLVATSAYGGYVLYARYKVGSMYLAPTTSPRPSANSSSLTAIPADSGGLSKGVIPIPGGTFTMGRDVGPEDERPAHIETVGPFLMDKTEVTNEEYYDFVKETGYKEIPAHWEDGKPKKGDEKHPVRYVNIDDINNFITWRSKRDGIVYRLPTEQEWEFAARNGAKGNLYPWGDTLDANCYGIDRNTTAPDTVGECSNEWGMVDLIGSLYEWTGSKAWLYPGQMGHIIKYQNQRYMIRGGGDFSRAAGEDLTAAFRRDVAASTRYKELGFRLVSSP